MKTKEIIRYSPEMDQLCSLVRALVAEGDFEECLEPICQGMEAHPHAPQPHNLLGIVLERKGEHALAMKHFRAAWALDPTYAPVSHNLNVYGTFFSQGKCAFDESDLPEDESNKIDIIYDDLGVGRVVSKKKRDYQEKSNSYSFRR